MCELFAVWEGGRLPRCPRAGKLWGTPPLGELNHTRRRGDQVWAGECAEGDPEVVPGCRKCRDVCFGSTGALW